MNERDKLVYEKISRKELTFGCMIGIKFYTAVHILIERIGDELVSNHTLTIDRNKAINRYPISSIDGERNHIIGHPILLSDVLNYIDNQEDKGYEFTTIVGMWNYKKPEYYYQTEECKKFIHSLIK